MNTKNRLITGSFFRILNIVLNVAVSFFMMPFLIRSLGDRSYGIWVVVGGFISYFSLLDLGLTKAVTRFISRALGRNDLDELGELSAVALGLYLVLSALALVVTVGLMMAARFFVGAEDIGLIRVLIFIVGLDFAISLPVRALQGCLSSMLRFDLISGVSILRVILNAAAVVWAIRAGHGILAIAVIQLAGSIFENTILVGFSVRHVPGIRLLPKWPGGKRFKEFFDYSLYVFATQIADILRFKVDSFVIAAYLGASPVTVYYIAAQLVNYIITVITNVNGMLTPVFSRYDGQQDLVSLREKFFLTTKISVVLSALFCGGALIFGRPFIFRWMGPGYNEAYPILAVLTVAMGVALAQSPSISLLYATSRHRFYAYANSIEGIANLVLSLLLVRRYGMMGVALGTAIPMIVVKTFVQPVYVCSVSDISLARYSGLLLRSTAACGVALLLPWLAMKPFIVPTYPSLFGMGAAFAVVFSTLALFLVFSSDERRMFMPVFTHWAVAS